MKPKQAKPFQSLQWHPAERLGQLSVESHLRPWLIGGGVLSVRMRTVCGSGYALRLVEQWTGLLSSSHKLGLRANDNAGLFRDVELYRANQVWVFAQTVAPDSTLTLHPWLAELGDTALDETLLSLSGVERSAYEYAWVPVDPVPDSPWSARAGLASRALRHAQVRATGLWARRWRVALRGAPLLMQEVFLPSMGRS